MTSCWRCGVFDDDVVGWAQSETPKRYYLHAHEKCLREIGMSGELIRLEEEE